MRHKATGILSSAGGSGGSHALKHLRQILSHNRVRVLADPEVRVRRGSEYFVDGRLTDPGVEAEIVGLIGGVLTLAASPQDVPDVSGSVFVVGSEERAADQIAALVAERGIRTLTALTRTDTQRVLRSRNIAAVVIDPGLGETDADLVEKDIIHFHPGALVLRPDTVDACADEVIDALRHMVP